MKYGLDILSDGELDLISLGTLNHRVDPEILLKTRKIKEFSSS